MCRFYRKKYHSVTQQESISEIKSITQKNRGQQKVRTVPADWFDKGP